MTKITMLTLAALMTLGSAGTVFAAGDSPDTAPVTTPPAHEEGGSDKGEGSRGPHRFFQDADVNKDDFLTKQELLDAQKKRTDQMFVDLDQDKDDKLSKEELKKGREMMREKMRKRFGKKPHDGVEPTEHQAKEE